MENSVWVWTFVDVTARRHFVGLLTSRVRFYEKGQFDERAEMKKKKKKYLEQQSTAGIDRPLDRDIALFHLLRFHSTVPNFDQVMAQFAPVCT